MQRNRIYGAGLEAVGNGFATRPLAITASSMKATTPLTKNLYGDNPLSKDDDKLQAGT